MRSSNKRIKNLIFLCSITAIILIVSTYAWFIGMRTVNVSSFDIEIATTDSLLISFDGDTWDSTASISEATLDDISYTGHTNWWAGNGLLPVSSIGDMDTEVSRMKLYEKASLTPTPGGYRLLASRVNNYENSNPEQEGYVAFDLFIKNFSGTQYIQDLNILDEEAIYLTTDSEVTVAASGVADTGIENSVRVAFAQIGRVAGTNTSPTTITGITCEPDVEGVPSVNGDITGICRTAKIWEPNDKSHVANAISWYNTSCVARTGVDVTLSASYSGSCEAIVDGTTYPTYAVSVDIESSDNVDVYDGAEYNSYEDTALLYAYPYFTDTMRDLTGTERPTFMMLAPNSITKVRVYIFIEGQDIDNYDFAAIGKAVSVKFGFTKERFIEGDINYDGPALNPEDETPVPEPAPEPVLLKDIVAIGDYVEYDAGNWSTTVAVPTAQGTFGGFASGNSKNQAIACESAGAIISGRYGWRVINVNGTTGEVSILHVGTPECYYHSTDTTTSISNLVNRDYSYYVNTNLASSATIFTKETAETLFGSSISYAQSLPSGTTITDLLRSGSRYYFPTTYNSTYLLYVQPGGYVSGDRYRANGIRPVVKLKADLYVLSGTGSNLEKYVVNGSYTAPPPATKNGLITGYWENWNSASANMRLKNIPSYYDIVALSFGYTEVGSSKGTVDFALSTDLTQRLSNYTETNFKNDIQILKASGKKVILSIGGAGKTIAVDDAASITAFVNSVNALITEYDFDGIDINFEGGISPTHLATAIRQVANAFGSNFVLTMAPQTVDFKVDIAGNVSGDYYTLLTSVKDITTIVNMQMYNSGSQYGLNGVEYFQGTVNFSTALATILIEKGLDDSQVGLGSNYNSSKGGYMLPSKFVDAYNSLINGGATIGGSYVVPHAYSDFGGFMIWSINGDYSIGNSFSNAFNAALIN